MKSLTNRIIQRHATIRRKMTGGNPSKGSKKKSKSNSSSGSDKLDRQNIRIRYEVKSGDEKFLMTYYGPVNRKQQPHGIGHLYVGPTLLEEEVFHGKFENGVVNDTSGKAPFLGITLFGLGYTPAIIEKGAIISFGNNEQLKEFQTKNIILNFNKMNKLWVEKY